jgi:hypothetical protein
MPMVYYAHLKEEKEIEREDTRQHNERSNRESNQKTFEEEWKTLFGPPPEHPEQHTISPLQALPDPAFLAIAHFCDLKTQLALAGTCVHVRGLLRGSLATAAAAHRLHKVTNALRRVLSGISLALLGIIIFFVLLVAGFFALVMFFGNRYLFYYAFYLLASQSS